MKLYLSSYRIPNKQALRDLIGSDFQATALALVPNAKDYYAGKARDFKIRAALDGMQNLGFQASVIDLKNFDDSQELYAALKSFDMIWVMGGNTFVLMSEIRRSGLDKIMRRLLDHGIVYAGESAGALVAGNSLHGIEFFDEPDFADEVRWDGLGLTDHFVLPHVGSADYGEGVEKAKQQHCNDTTIIELTDTQAFVVDGEREYITTSNP